MSSDSSYPIKIEHDFDALTQYCKNCGVPRYAIDEFEILCSPTKIISTEEVKK